MGIILLIAGYVCRRWLVRGLWLAGYVLASVALAFVQVGDLPRGAPFSAYLRGAAYVGAMAAVYGVIFLAVGRAAAAVSAWVRRGEPSPSENR